jgi:hypothetical protein
MPWVSYFLIFIFILFYIHIDLCNHLLILWLFFFNCIIRSKLWSGCEMISYNIIRSDKWLAFQFSI